MKIGYARVSTHDQNLDPQTTALQNAACERIYQDKLSGSKRERPGLQRALEHLRAGDTLAVWKLDRLGRRVKDLAGITGRTNEGGTRCGESAGARRWAQAQNDAFQTPSGTAASRQRRFAQRCGAKTGHLHSHALPVDSRPAGQTHGNNALMPCGVP